MPLSIVYAFYGIAGYRFAFIHSRHHFFTGGIFGIQLNDMGATRRFEGSSLSDGARKAQLLLVSF